MYDKVEAILSQNPKMSTTQLLREYLSRHTKRSQSEVALFLEVLEEAYVPSIVRMAAKYRQNLGIRDEVRQALAEEERRHVSQTRVLEKNPPEIYLHQDLFV